MKKKVLSLILALALILPCALTISACKKPDPTPAPVYYNVTFVYGNGTADYVTQVEAGKFAVEPTAPTKEGHDFDGWYVGDFKWGFSFIPVNNDITLTAKWSVKPYGVTFVYANGMGSKTETYYYGEKIVEPEAPVKEGYTFVGWYSGETLWNFDTEITGAVTLTAHWVRTEFTVTFNEDNGNEPFTVKVAQGDKVACPDVIPEKEGYVFDGWYLGEFKWNFDYNVITEDITITAHWSLIPCEVTFVYNNGLDDKIITYYYGDRISTPLAPVKVGHEFMGWFNGTSLWNFGTVLTGPVTLTAEWMANAQSVIFVYNNGEDDEVVTYRYGEKIIEPDAPTKEGYSFAGWFYGDDVWNFEEAITRDIKLTAHWDLITFYINYELDGGENNENNPTEYSVEKKVVFQDPVRDGYKFAGWYLDGVDNQKILSTEGLLEDITVYAKWLRINAITYMLDGGVNNKDNPETFTVEDEITLLAPTKDNYCIFGGWYLDSGFNYEVTVLYGGAEEDITVYAKWDDIFVIDAKGELLEKITGLTEVGATLKKLTIPQNVETIDMGAFNCARYLEEVEFEAGSRLLNIDYYAFENCTKLSKIALPSRLVYIEGAAFSGCESLTSIIIPSSVCRIHSYAFDNCFKLETVTFGENSELEDICDKAFYDCKALKSIILPASLIGLCESAFEGCSKLETVTFSEGCLLDELGEKAFYGCEALKGIILPNGLSEIGVSAFEGCNSLAEITLPFVGNAKTGPSYTHFGYIFGADRSGSNGSYVPSTLKKVTVTGGTAIDVFAFENCSSIEEVLLPNTLVWLNGASFKNCTSLTSISFGKNSALTYIGEDAFNGDGNLVSIEIPARVSTIDERAFENCHGLEIVTVEDGPTLLEIDDYAFSGCTSLETASLTRVRSIGVHAFEGDYTLLNVPFADFTHLQSIGEYAFSGATSLISVDIPFGVRTINAYSFNGCHGLESVSIPQDVSIIGEGAFKDCSSLVSVTFAEVTRPLVIGRFAFSGCKDLTSFTIPSGVVDVQSGAFSYCTKLATVSIPSSITEISDGCFRNCESLTTVSIPEDNKITGIGDVAFSSCLSLTNFSIPSGVTQIGSMAFESCKKLSSVALPEALESIGEYAFQNCEALATVSISAGCKITSFPEGTFNFCYSLSSVLIPKTVTSIGEKAFSYTAITSIFIPNSVVTIEKGAFESCDKLEMVIFEAGSQMTTISESTFGYCEALTSITIPDTIILIGERAFTNCKELASFTLPASLTKIEDYAFSSCEKLKTIYNYSSLVLEKGSLRYGEVALYAEAIITE